MFATFLAAVVLASLAALAALLATPQPAGGAPVQARTRTLPWTTLTVVVLVAALAFVGGLMWGA